jgi:hypothetical protein
LSFLRRLAFHDCFRPSFGSFVARVDV